MKRSAFIVPGIAAVLAAAIVAFVGPFNSPVTRAASSLTFEATFTTSSDFYDRFDYGYSGLNPIDVDAAGNDVIGIDTPMHGDHNDACQAPTTLRDVNFGGTGDALDFSELFWHCAPGNDPAKGHVMGVVDTHGYNHSWFAPKPTFNKVSKVCWDQNLTRMSGRKWQELQFVSEADATRYPSGTATHSGGADSEARGTGGFDLGYTKPGFREDAPNTGVFPQGGTLAGLSYRAGVFGWFQDQNTWTNEFAGWPGLLDADINDKATRYTHCLIDDESGTLRITQARPAEFGGTATIELPGDIPDWPVRVVWHDANYNPPKDELYDATEVTWHYDNVQVFTDSDTPPTTTPPTTTPPTTTPPTTTPPTTTPPTTTPPTTTPPTTTPPTTTPPTTTPPTTTPPTTTPPTTTPPTTTPPTTEPPPTTAPPTTTPPTTTPPTTSPPTTSPPTTAPPTTAPPTTAPPTTAPPTTTPPTTNPPFSPFAPIVRITSGPEGTTTESDAMISFDVRNRFPFGFRRAGGVTVTCSLDGQAPVPCSSPVRYDDLDLGKHEVVINATWTRGRSLFSFKAGGSASARHSWAVVPTVDDTDPSAVLANQASTGNTTGVQRTVLSFTGSHITEIAIVGLMLIAVGLVLGSAAAVTRRRSD